MSARKTLFVLSIFVVPAMLWILRATPALDRRTEALAKIEESYTKHARDTRTVQDHDHLKKEWDEFRPTADERLVDLENRLNPYLIQLRVSQIARELQFEQFTINEKKRGTDGPPNQYTIKGRSSFESILLLVDRLERGSYLVRFDQLKIKMPADRKLIDEGVMIEGTFSIPVIPPSRSASRMADDALANPAPQTPAPIGPTSFGSEPTNHETPENGGQGSE